MNKKFIGVLLFLALSIPYAAFAESDEDAAVEVEDTETTEATEESTALESGNGWKTVRIVELGKSGKFVHLVLIDHARHTDKTIYSNAIRRLCNEADADFCRVRFWSEARHVPDRVAMTPDQRKHLKADFLINKTAGMHHLQWSCSVDPLSENCL